MMPRRPHPRRQPPNVYRLRRAVAASAAVLLVFGVLQVTGLAGGDGDDSAATTTTASTTTTTIPSPPACTDGDVIAAEDPAAAWATILVDTERALPNSYVPGDLENISEAGFPFTPGLALRGLVMDDLRALREAAAANGTPISILAAFRSYAQQADLYERRVDELGSEAGSRVARPGHSEHQLGTTLDITDEGATDVDQSWGASPAGQWIAGHAHEYGFLISYPAGAEARTCYDFEPWHLRYVGRELAAAVIDSGLTIREHLWAFAPPAGAPQPTASTAAP